MAKLVVYDYIINQSEMRTGISCVYQGLVQTRAIYISDLESATDTNLMKELNITSIVTAAKQIKLGYPCGNIKDYLFIPAEDRENYQIQLHFDEVYDFIEKGRSRGNILIHCAFGVSRSAALVLAYFIRKHRYSADHALSVLRKKRPIVNPNPGFMRALQIYSQKYCGSRIDLLLLGGVNQYRQIRKINKMKKTASILVNYQGEIVKNQQQQSLEVQQAFSTMLKTKNEVEERLQAVQQYYQFRCAKSANNKNDHSLGKHASKELKKSLKKVFSY